MHHRLEVDVHPRHAKALGERLALFHRAAQAGGELRTVVFHHGGRNKIARHPSQANQAPAHRGRRLTAHGDVSLQVPASY